MIPIVTYANARDVVPSPATLESWEHLGAMLAPSASVCAPCEDPKGCPGKAGLAWSPVKIVGFRADANVREVYALVLDFDKANAAVLDRIRSETAGLKRILHSTHSHRPPDAGAFRVVLALSRPVPADEWTAFYLAAIDLLDLPADRTCANPSRIYFLPTYPEGLPFLHEVTDGELVDVDAILETIPPAQRKKKYRAPTTADSVPEVPAPPVDLADLVKGLTQLARKYEKADDLRVLVLRAVLSGTPLAVEGERDARVHQAASICAAKFPAGTPVDAAIVILRPSIAAMPCEPEGLEYWLDKARFSYRRAMDRRIESDAKVREVNKTIERSLHAIVRDRAKGHGAPPSPDPDDVPEAEGTAPGVEDLEQEEDDWFKDLKFKPITKEGDTPKLVACEHNAAVILGKSPAWRDKVRFNEVTKQVEVDKSAPLAATDRHSSVLPRAVANWLQQEYDLFLGEGNVASILLLVARRAPYDPIREYLDAIRWDGKERLNGWLISYCQAEVGDDAEDLEHVKRTGRRFLIGAAARALRPGCQMDTVLVLEGEEGVRKTTLFRVLGGVFYSSSMIDLSDKDTKLLAAQTWIVELAELTSLRKSDDEAAKAFLTTTEDRFRPPYGAAIEVFPRRAVFVGTTNAVEDGSGGYLKGRTGNRRWWPVKVGPIDIPAIKIVRDQLWAEAVVHAKRALAALDAGADPMEIPDEDRWWHVGGEETKARKVAQQRVERTMAHDLFEHWWFAIEPGKRPRYQTMPECLVNVYKKPLGDLSQRQRIDLGYVLADYGFVKKFVRIAERPMRIYEAPEMLLNAPRQVKGASGLVVVDGGVQPRKAGPEE